MLYSLFSVCFIHYTSFNLLSVGYMHSKYFDVFSVDFVDSTFFRESCYLGCQEPLSLEALNIMSEIWSVPIRAREVCMTVEYQSKLRIS